MADVSVQMGVSGVSQFKSQMSQAQASVKSIDAALRLNEKQYKATGDAEAYMQNKTTQLNSKLQAQQNAVKAAENALKAMKDSGVDPLSEAYQKMEAQMLNAQSAVLDTQQQINELGTETAETAGRTNELANSLQGLNKKVSLDQVINGIGKITSGLEAAASKAVDVGKSIWDDIKTAAKWADDSATMAEMYDVPLERYLQMEALYKEGLDTSTTAILDSMSYVNRKVGKESAETMKYLTELGLVTTKTIDTGFGKTEEVQRLFTNSEDLFWKAGKAIFEMGNQFDKEAAATAIFGKSWKELTALFKNYGSLEEYNAALEDTTVNSEDAVKKMAELNDKIGKLEESWNTAKFEVLSSLAGPLKDAAEAIATLLNRITEYLKTDEGQEKLKKMEEAVSALFSDLSSIDPEKVVENFASVFEGIVNSFQWISNHWTEVKNGIRGIAIAFGALKVAQIGLNIANLVNGLGGLVGSGATAAAAQAGAAAGSAWGSGFASAAWGALKVAGPIGAFLITLLTPADTDAGEATINDKLMFEEGNNRTEYENKIKELIGDDVYNPIMKTKGSDGSTIWYADSAEKIDELFQSGATVEEAAKALKEFGIEQKRIINTYTEDELEEFRKQQEERDKQNNWYYNEWLPEHRYTEPEEEKYKMGDELSQAIEEYYDLLKMPQTSDVVESLVDQYDKLSELLGGDEGMVDAIQERLKEIISEGDMMDDLPEDWYAELPLEPELAEDAAGSIQGQLSALGVFTVPFKPAMIGGNEDGFAANGLWSVPFDGYHAILHRGERVVPAREVGSSRNYSSNLYVESMYMNNGTDAEGLAAAMAAAQRRTMSGYGN